MSTKKTISGLTPGTWGFRFRAINDTGLSGDWSPVFTYTVIGDTTPPPVPSKPNVTSVVGGVSVKWVETGYQTPIDFNRVDVYVSSGGSYVKFGSIASINTVVTYVPPEGITGPFTFKFTGVDRSGNVSAFSEASDSVSSGTIGIDTTPPSVPSGLSVLAYNDPSDTSGSTGYADVSWTGSTSTDLLGHYVRYGRTSSVWDEYLFIQSGQNTKRIFNLKSGTTYYFQVNATDGSNPSAYVPSTPISVLIPGDTTAPLAPQNLSAVSGLDYIIAYWDRNSENDVDLARGQYQVQISISSSFSSVVEDSVITGTVATFNGLTTGTLYYLRVRATDSSGNSGPWSSIASTTPSTINAQTAITSGTIVGNLIAANTIIGDKIQANTVDADRFKTNTGIAGIIYVGSDDSPTGTNRIVIDGSSLLPKIYYGSGVYNNSNTSFYIDAAGKFSLKDQLSWDGSALTVRGSLNVTQASTMTANLNINSGGSLIVNGGAIRVTGTAGRVEMSSLGLVGYNASTGGSPLVTIQANTGQIVATGGQIGGFTLGPTSLTTTNSSGQAVGLYSSGQFSLGSNFNVSAAGDLTATGTFTIAGTGQTAIAANQVNSNVTSISGGVISTGTINLNNVLINSGSGTTSTMKLSSSGLEIWNSSGTRTVFLTPSGNASFNGEITSTTGTIAGFTMDADGLINSGGTLRLFAGTTGINNVFSIFTSKPVRFADYVSVQGTGGFNGYSFLGQEGMSLANGGFAINSSGTVTSNATFNAYIYYPGYPVSTSGGAARVNDATTPSSRLVAASGSSIRFKENIVNISEKPDLDPSTLLNLPVRSFTYKQGYLPEDDARYGMDLPGFIAEELEEVYPIAVDRDADGTPQRWNADFIIPGLLKIIQTQNDSILSIKSRLDALES
jgi:chitodextrinase